MNAMFGYARKIGDNRCCIRFQSAITWESFSGSWFTATHTGPGNAPSLAARSLAHASPAPDAICAHDSGFVVPDAFGVVNDSHGSLPAWTSRLARATAPVTWPPAQNVRCTPSLPPKAASRGSGSWDEFPEADPNIT